jgi:hypothetical protein
VGFEVCHPSQWGSLQQVLARGNRQRMADIADMMFKVFLGRFSPLVEALHTPLGIASHL